MWILVIFVIFMISFIVYLSMQSSRIYIRKLEVAKKNLPGSFRFVQITDFHANPWVDLTKLREEIFTFGPHVIVMTGDMVDHACQERRAMELVEILLSTGVPVVAVAGNHDVAPGVTIMEEMTHAGVRVLADEAEDFSLNGVHVRIAGLAYPVRADVYDALVDCDAEYTLLLAHTPFPLTRFLDTRTDLALAGHTHGGQARIPLLGAWYVPGEGFFPRYDKGLFRVGGSKLFISSGLGNTLAPIRVGNPVEIVFGTVKGE